MTEAARTPAALLLLAIVTAGCTGVPDHVIQPEQMARLMADIRMADAVVNINGREYRADSSRQALRLAVFDRNGVTPAQFDTSLVWYGHNIAEYQKVTDRSIEILEGRLAAAGSVPGQAAMSVAGDSVDIWTAPVTYTVTRRSPSRYITFSLDSDPNWEKGDAYTWRFRFIVPPAEAAWAITTEYDDGAVEVQNVILSPTAQRADLTFYTDSTRTARNINGWLRLSPDGHRPAVIDSMGLVRRRATDGVSRPRNYRQHIYVPADKPTHETDTASTAR